MQLLCRARRRRGANGRDQADVSPDARGRGIGRAVLAALEAEARALGIVRLVLETGLRQGEALALYERDGFSRIPPFGEYVNSPLSACMAKDL